jgi:hypothetical protein
MTIDDLLRSLLNPNPGGNQLAQAGQGYLPQTGLSPDMVARFHAMSGLSGPQAALQTSAAPQGAPQVAPMPQAAPAAPQPAPQVSGNGILSRLFGGGRSDTNPALNETAAWLEKQGYDPATAMALAGNKEAMQKILVGQVGSNKPVEVNGRLVDPRTGQVVADFSTPQHRQTTVVNGKVVDTDTGKVIGDYGSTPQHRQTAVIDGKLVDTDTGKVIGEYGAAKPIEVNGRLLDPRDYHVLADFSTPPNRQTATINGKLVDTNTGNVIGDYGTANNLQSVGKDSSLYDPKTGKWITPPAQNQSGGFRFDSTSVEGQALNGLIDSGQLTAEQAQQLAAGKMVTNPADGSIIFMTPQGIFGKSPNGGPAQPSPFTQAPGQPVQPGANAPIPTQSSAVPPPTVPPVGISKDPNGGLIVTPPPDNAAGPAAQVPGANPGAIQVTGAKPSGKKTESEERYSTISTVLLNEVPTLGANFKAMADPTSQLLSKLGPLGNYWQSEEYQRAAYSVTTSVSNILYALSGSSSNPGEVIKQIGVLTPEFGDKPGAIADKLQRFKTYVRAVAASSGDPKIKQMVDDALTKMDAPSPNGAPAAQPSGDGWKQVAPGLRIRRVN